MDQTQVFKMYIKVEWNISNVYYEAAQWIESDKS